MQLLSWIGTALYVATLAASAAATSAAEKNPAAKDIAALLRQENRRPNLAPGGNPALLRAAGAAAGLLQVGRRVGSCGPPAPAASAGKGRLSRPGRRLAQRAAARRSGWRPFPAGPAIASGSSATRPCPGLFVPALLYEPEKLAGRVPAIMNVNGHVGPPGKAVPYKQIRCINQAKRGMLALNVEWLGMGQLGGPGFQHGCMNQLDLCGTSGLAPFYLAHAARPGRALEP